MVLSEIFGPDGAPEYLVKMVAWAGFFYVVELVSWAVLQRLVPKYMESLDPISERSYVTKSTSTVHAAMTTGFSGYIISVVHNFGLDEMHTTLPLFQALCALSGGFFLMDIMGMGRNAFTHYPADLAHHSVSFAIALKGIFATEFEHIMYYGPWMLLVEFTTVFMNATLLMCGLRHKPRPENEITPAIRSVDLKLKMAFAGSFFLLRAIMFPIVIGHMHWSWPEQFTTSLGGGMAPFCYLLVVMQWVWMYKIMRIAVKTAKKAKTK